MGELERWPHLGSLCQVVQTHAGLQIWLFGSALTSRRPADLDVLLIYRDLADVAAIRSAHPWEDELPPINIIAMTTQEENDYSFIRGTGARRLV